MIHTQNILHQVIGLTNQLHVAILNAIMDHFHKMTCTLISDLQNQIIDKRLSSHTVNIMYTTHIK